MTDLFYVAMNDEFPGTAHACCAVDRPSIVKDFYEGQSDYEIRIMPGKDMGRLLKAYGDAKLGQWGKV